MKHSVPGWLWVALITVGLLVPFLGKAYHIDDPLFVWAAQQIRQEPLDFYGFEVNWYGGPMPMHEVMQNPPAASYVMAAASTVLGFSATAMHTVFLIWAVLLAVGTWQLARGFCAHPMAAALACMATPVVILSASNVMCDIMMLSLWVWAIVFWRQGLEHNKTGSLVIAGALMGLCALTKYYGMALLPLCLVYGLVKMKKPGPWLAMLLIPVSMLIIYQWATHGLYGQGLLTAAADYSTKERWEDGSLLIGKLGSAMAFIGGGVVTLIAFAPLLWSWRMWILWVGCAAGITLAVTVAEQVGTFPLTSLAVPTWWFALELGIMATAGISLLVLVGQELSQRRNAETLLLFLWVVGTVVFAGLINWSVNGRSILPLAPAAGILILRRLEWLTERKAFLAQSDRGDTSKKLAALRAELQSNKSAEVPKPTPVDASEPVVTSEPAESSQAAESGQAVETEESVMMAGPLAWWRWALPLIPVVGLSLMAGLADMSVANTSRVAAMEFAASYSTARDKERLRFQGHWGFQYYMEQAGFKAMNMNKVSLARGAVFVIPRNNTGIRFEELRNHLDNLNTYPPPKQSYRQEVVNYPAFPLISTMDQTLGSCFYADVRGPIPYGFGEPQMESYCTLEAL